MTSLRNRLSSLSNAKSLSFWRENMTKIENLISRQELKTYLLSPFNIEGLPTENYNRMFMYYVGPYVYSEKPFLFAKELETLYQQEGYVLIYIIPLKESLGFKVVCSGLLLCSVYPIHNVSLEIEEKESTFAHKKISYLATRYYLPMIYRWIDEKRYDKGGDVYINQMEEILSKRLSTSEEPRKMHGPNMKQVITDLDVVVTGIAAARKILYNEKDITTPIELISTNAALMLEQLHIKLEKELKEKVEVFTMKVDHPGLEKYITAIRYVSKEKMICTLYDYPTFALTNIYEQDGIKYTAKISTLIMLHIISWLTERKGHDFAKMINALIVKLREAKDVTSTTYYGTYYDLSDTTIYDAIMTKKLN